MKSPREFFQALAKRDALAHAYLFSGNDTAEKKEVTESLVLNIHCQDQKKQRACMECSSCIAIEKGMHPDVSRILPEEMEITIGQIQKLGSFLSLSSLSGKKRVVIMEQADTMNSEAQSAFLKLLEEPRGDVLFLLLAEYPGQLFSTILSRTQEIPFIQTHVKLKKEEEQWVKDLKNLQRQGIATRFAYAKKMADSPEDCQAMMKAWSVFLRELLLRRVQENQPYVKIVAFLRKLEETSYLLRTTNVSTQLGLERLLLYL